MGLEMADKEETRELTKPKRTLSGIAVEVADEIGASYDHDDGTTTPIKMRDIALAVEDMAAGRTLLPDNTFTVTAITKDLAFLDVNLAAIGDFNSDQLIPIGEGASVTPGRFIVGFRDGENPSDAVLFFVGGSHIVADKDEDKYECKKVQLVITDENDEDHELTQEDLHGVSPDNIWQARRPNGELVDLNSLLGGLIFLKGIQAAYDNMAEEIQPANVKTIDVWNNHSLSAKVVIDGLFEIASGRSSYKITPRNKNSRSNESYEITANKEACTRLFGDGGTKWTVEAVLQTVYNLRTSKDAEKFVYQGRVWITVNTIVQEMRRTKAGTVEANKYRNDRKLVDNALLAASGAQVVGTTPDGKLTNTYYLLNAVRRDRVTYKGHEYRDVWGIVPDAETLNDYATSLGHVYRYPLLAWPSRDEDDRYRSFSLEDREIDSILRNLENKARGQLYKTDENNNPKPQRRKSCIVTRSWDRIFTGQSPITPLNSHQKLNLVKEFQKVLEVHVAMDAKDETRPGYPLYIIAYSTRIAGRGKGGGAWDNLVLKCWRTYHKTSVDLVKGGKKSQNKKVEK